MRRNSRLSRRSGLTLVEVLIAIMLVSVAAAVVYTELIYSYRILMRSRARLDAQGMAFDKLWEVYNLPMDQLPTMSMSPFSRESAPTNSVLHPYGIVECVILAEIDAPTLPDPVKYWDIYVKVWPGTNSPIDLGNRPLAGYHVKRYRGHRQKGGE